MPVNLKRIYDQAEQNDGVRVLVDRVWPRGISKTDAKLDYWLKEIGPSSELRKWFNHDPEKYETFKQKYKDELTEGRQKEELDELRRLTREHDKQLTLLFAAKDDKHNQARVLKEILDRQ